MSQIEPQGQLCHCLILDIIIINTESRNSLNWTFHGSFASQERSWHKTLSLFIHCAKCGFLFVFPMMYGPKTNFYDPCFSKSQKVWFCRSKKMPYLKFRYS